MEATTHAFQTTNSIIEAIASPIKFLPLAEILGARSKGSEPLGGNRKPTARLLRRELPEGKFRAYGYRDPLDRAVPLNSLNIRKTQPVAAKKMGFRLKLILRRDCSMPRMWPERDLNSRHKDFQSSALPTELSGPEYSPKGNSQQASLAAKAVHEAVRRNLRTKCRVKQILAIWPLRGAQIFRKNLSVSLTNTRQFSLYCT